MDKLNESALPLSLVAKHLDTISEWQLREAVRNGVVPATRYGGRIFIFPSDLRASELGRHWRDLSPAGS